MENIYYLREDVYIDPLVNYWYAWPNLIAPVTYALYMTKTHRRLINSFLNNQELHILANQDKTLAGGGEFVDCASEQAGALKTLLDMYESEHGIYSEISEAIKRLDTLLRSHKGGMTIEPLYDLVPDTLKGYVELFMDLYHQPSFRLIEGLLYKSSYYKEEMQSVSFGIMPKSGSRPFVLSTPRLPDDSCLHLRVPFKSDVLDDIFRARVTPISSSDIDQIFEGRETVGGLSRHDLFTTDPPYVLPKQAATDVTLSYIGHAGFLIENGDCAIMVDPLIAYRVDSNRDDVITYGDLPQKIDYLCLTHNHADHVNIETLLQIRHKVDKVLVPKNNGGTLCDPSLKLVLKQLAFSVIEVEDLEEIPLESGRIISIPFLGEHGDLNVRSKTAWFFELHGKTIYAGADSSNIEPRMYEHVRKITGKLDVLAIGMECVGAPYTWLYGALTTEMVSKSVKESRRLNGSDFEKAAQMVATFEPEHVLIYALGLESWYDYLTGIDYTDDSEQMIQSGKLLAHCEGLGVKVDRLNGKFVLAL
jgi:L-ascorbate metabolism protein UlaG (beta-lactamase superfamily)